MKPWERYQQTQPTEGSKPWEQYQQPTTEQVIGTPSRSGFNQGQYGRGAELANIVDATKSGEQSIPEGLLQGAGHVVGTGADVVGAGIGKAAGAAYSAMPTGAQEALATVGQYIAESPVGELAEQGIEAYGQNLAAYNKQSPRAGRNLQAVRELGNLVPLGVAPVRSVTKGAIGAGRRVSKMGPDVPLPKAAAPIYKADAVKGISSDLYKKADEVGGVLKPEARDAILKKVESLADIGGEKVTSGKDVFEEMFETMSKRKGKNLTLAGAEKIDKKMTTLIQKERTLDGITPEGLALSDLQDDLRNAMYNPQESMVVGGKKGFEALKGATSQWSAAKKLEDIQGILDHANKMDNPATSIKAQFRVLSKNKKRMAGYTDAEKKLINQAAESSKFADFLRTVAGSRLISGIVGTAGGAVGGGGVGALAGATAGATISGGSRSAAKALQKGRVSRLEKEVSKRVRVPKEIYDLSPKEAKKAMKALRKN